MAKQQKRELANSFIIARKVNEDEIERNASIKCHKCSPVWQLNVETMLAHKIVISFSLGVPEGQ